MLTPEWSSL